MYITMKEEDDCYRIYNHGYYVALLQPYKNDGHKYKLVIHGSLWSAVWNSKPSKLEVRKLLKGYERPALLRATEYRVLEMKK